MRRATQAHDAFFQPTALQVGVELLLHAIRQWPANLSTQVASNLQVSIKEDRDLKTADTTLSAQEASAATAYRQQVSVTTLANGPAELRVLVTMDVAEGSTFGWFSVPLSGEPLPEKELKAPLLR